MPGLDALPIRGNYTLIILLKGQSRIKMVRYSQLKLDKGYYAYTGSAIGQGAVSLRRRVARHFRKEKKIHWHIDYLLASKTAYITAVVAAASKDNKECEISRLIRNIEGATVPITGFGASDCKHNCESHLIQLGENNKLEKIADAYKHVVGEKQLRIYKP